MRACCAVLSQAPIKARLSHAYRLIPPGTKPAAFATMVK